MQSTVQVDGYRVVNEMPLYSDQNAKQRAEQAAVKGIGASCGRLHHFEEAEEADGKSRTAQSGRIKAERAKTKRTRSGPSPAKQ